MQAAKRSSSVRGSWTTGSGGSWRRTARKAPRITADVAKRYQVSVYGSSCRDAILSVIGSRLQHETVMRESQTPREFALVMGAKANGVNPAIASRHGAGRVLTVGVVD